MQVCALDLSATSADVEISVACNYIHAHDVLVYVQDQFSIMSSYWGPELWWGKNNSLAANPGLGTAPND